MARKRKPNRPGGRRSQTPSSERAASTVTVRRTKDGAGWELVHPRCALERADDLAEVQAMIEGGAADVAIDELRWLLDGCSDFVAAHYLLGELALEEDRDYTLGRAHFGYAYQLGLTALRRAGVTEKLSFAMPANQDFFGAGKGLAFCLRELGKPEMAAEVLDMLIALDPDAPLALAEMRTNLPPNTT